MWVTCWGYDVLVCLIICLARNVMATCSLPTVREASEDSLGNGHGGGVGERQQGWVLSEWVLSECTFYTWSRRLASFPGFSVGLTSEVSGWGSSLYLISWEFFWGSSMELISGEFIWRSSVERISGNQWGTFQEVYVRLVYGADSRGVCLKVVYGLRGVSLRLIYTFVSVECYEAHLWISFRGSVFA